MKILKGWIGEKKTGFYLWLSLSSKVYTRFHNLIIPGKNGTSQIDHLLVSRFGLFIIETKNKKGWIFGSESQSQWSQILFRKKYLFQNPLRQTYRQRKVLAEFLGLDESKIHEVVYFVGDCTFKTKMPMNVLKTGLGRYIRKFREPILAVELTDQITDRLNQYLASSHLRGRDHRRSLKQRHDSKTTCPRCGAELTERVAKNGPNSGSKFLGCRNYPNCRYTKSI